MKYYQDTDTGNCYALEYAMAGTGETYAVGPTKDSVNAPVAGMDIEIVFVNMCLTPVDRETVSRDHPRLLAYLADVDRPTRNPDGQEVDRE